MKILLSILIMLGLLNLTTTHVLAAVGCELNDPDRDVARLFPESTGYKTHYLSLDKKGGQELLHQIEQRLGDQFQGLFETIDIPYTIYEIYRGTDTIGYIHGVNQKGKHGGLQVFLTFNVEGVITSFYYQKLTSKAAKQLRAPDFGQQFVGLSLRDFYNYNVVTGQEKVPGRVSAITNPAPEAENDFRATLRGTKKNLVLMDELVFGNKYLPYFGQELLP